MNIGFMQGRLCDRIDDKIQAFPWRDWELEFKEAQKIGFNLMEWTLDHDRLYENPLMTEIGRKRIRELSIQHNVQINSLTGDCFMQAPFFKFEGSKRESLLDDLRAIIEASAATSIRFVLIPLVDNGSIENLDQKASLIDGLLPLRNHLINSNIKIVFESDLSAQQLANFIDSFPDDSFGINYDIGNSAALGYDHKEEIASYGSRIDNVHIKDRLFSGTTVPLGTGNANFPVAFRALKQSGYSGSFILQTARAENNDHSAVLKKYRDMSLSWWSSNES